jgi:hypothetical protein
LRLYITLDPLSSRDNPCRAGFKSLNSDIKLNIFRESSADVIFTRLKLSLSLKASRRKLLISLRKSGRRYLKQMHFNFGMSKPPKSDRLRLKGASLGS